MNNVKHTGKSVAFENACRLQRAIVT